MRAFIGIPLPGDLAGKIYHSISDLRRDAPGIKWVRHENYHITVLFLGEIREDEITRAANIMDGISCNGGLDASLGPVGQFPPKGVPRVVFAGLAEGVECCRSVYTRLAGALPEYGESRRYVPHITLGRAKRGRRTVLKYAGIELPADRFELTEVVLFQSILSPTGPEYRKIHSTAL